MGEVGDHFTRNTSRRIYYVENARVTKSMLIHHLNNSWKGKRAWKDKQHLCLSFELCRILCIVNNTIEWETNNLIIRIIVITWINGTYITLFMNVKADICVSTQKKCAWIKWEQIIDKVCFKRRVRILTYY